MITLMLVDDHAIVREGLKQLLALAPDLEVLAEAATGASALAQLRQARPDLVLLDLSMPGLSGEDLVESMRARFPGLPILVLSMHHEPQIAQRTLRAGANGYLSKDCDPGTLLEAIHRVAEGGRYLPPGLAEVMAFEAAGVQARPAHTRLTQRELQIFRLIAEGFSINEIAAQLAISNKTVSTHKARFMEKMGFLSNAELIRYAITHDPL
jgi:DNA-binding NarL/FixJ family response regulator